MASFSLLLSILLLLCNHTSSESPAEKKAISDFLAMVPHRARISPKNNGSSACHWLGVQCINGDGAVSSLRFPATGLVGSIPNNIIGNLPDLKILSLRSNRLIGEIPTDFSSILQLHSLFLQDNSLSGSFPPAFSSLKNLARLDISSNKFNGTLPSSIRNMKGLKFLFLQNNNFSGSLPDLDGLSFTNFSNNNFNGSIPVSLSHFPPSVFIGNPALCGLPLPPCTQPATNKNSNKLSTAGIVAICVGSVLLLSTLIAAAILCSLRKRKSKKNQATPASTLAVSSVETGASSSKEDKTGASIETEKNKLVFLHRGAYTFDLEDLLRASAEVLGKGSFGTSYKALLEEGTSVVVKRLKDVVLTKKDFEAQMELLSHIKHDNVVPVRAYYYSKDEKLLVSDYISHGSLSSLLHGSRGEGRVVLEWIDRLRITIDVAKALTHIHSTGRLVHGNLKSSNILISDGNKAAVCDYGLNTLFGNSTGNKGGGYVAPEVAETSRASAKSDVYSFGVVVLELLTGRGAGQGGSTGEEGGDLPRWVQSVVREEWTAEVFDGEMGGGRGVVDEDMVHMLQLGMNCVSHVPDQRPPMAEVVRVLEEMVRG